jgi:hypothetical protein
MSRATIKRQELEPLREAILDHLMVLAAPDPLDNFDEEMRQQFLNVADPNWTPTKTEWEHRKSIIELVRLQPRRGWVGHLWQEHAGNLDDPVCAWIFKRKNELVEDECNVDAEIRLMTPFFGSSVDGGAFDLD